MSDTCIVNPLHRGMPLIIPKGTPIRSMHPQDPRVKHAGRKFEITVHHCSDGWVDVDNYDKRGRGFVRLPSVTWPGSGGYWQTVKLTPEFCKVNGIPVPEIPNPDSAYYPLDVVPSYDHGYCDRDDAPPAP